MISRDLSSASAVVNNESSSIESNPIPKNYEEKLKSLEENGQENMATLATTLIPADDNVQDEDVMIEENITPFYMTSGKT